MTTGKHWAEFFLPEVSTSVSWRVTSCREDTHAAGYWTSSYLDEQDAINHATKMRNDGTYCGRGGVSVYRVTFTWHDFDDIDNRRLISEIWEGIR